MIRRFLVLILLLTAATVTAQDTPTRDSAPISADLQIQIDTLETFTEDLRDLAPTDDLILKFPTRDEVSAFFAEYLGELLDDAAVEEQVTFYTAFDLLTPDLDLRQTVIDLYSQQVAGFYDTETKEMNVILTTGDAPGDRLPLMERIVYVHEYIHVLQDQNFGLDAIQAEAAASENGDHMLATLALIEGDATFIMNTYLLAESQANPFGTLLSLTFGGLQAGNLFLPPGIPDIIVAELMYPYEVGEVFVRALYDEGGWDRVNAAYQNPPTTTEQVIHPDKYLAGEMPRTVTLAEDASPLDDDWTLAQSGVLGQFYLREFLDVHLTGDEATEAASGWNGDAYRIYRQDSGDNALLLHLAWDTPADAAEFVTLVGTMGLADAADGCRATETRVYCIQTIGDDEVLFSAAPTLATAQALLD